MNAHTRISRANQTFCLNTNKCENENRILGAQIQTCLHRFFGPFCECVFLCLIVCGLDLKSEKKKRQRRFCGQWSLLVGRMHRRSYVYSPLKTCRLQTPQPRWRREALAWTRSPCCCWFCTCRSSALAPSASASAACFQRSEMNRGHSCWLADLSSRQGPDLLLQKHSGNKARWGLTTKKRQPNCEVYKVCYTE